MDQKVRDTAEKLFRSKFEKLTELEKHVAHHITERTPILKSRYPKEYSSAHQLMGSFGKG
jgi:hypothetical protein